MHHDLRGIIFDFDGTIAETERRGQRVAYNRAFVDLGLGWTWDEELYADLLNVAGGKERLRYYMARYRPEISNEAVREELIVELHRAKIRNFAAIAPRIPFRPGVQRLIYQAHSAGLRVAIATTASKPGVEALIAQDSALPAMVDLIAANEAVERKKPAPDVYLWALERLALTPETCVAIEDSNIGLRSALSAGLKTIITTSDYTAGDDFSGASAVLSGLGDFDVAARSLQGIAPPGGIVDLAFLQTVLVEPIRAR